jgi:anthranilate phosphoribosyltransferase
MSYSRYIRAIVDPHNDSGNAGPVETQEIFAAVFDGGVPDLELGALVVALHAQAPSAAGVASAYRAMENRVQRLRRPDTACRPLIFASYNVTRESPNLLPWLALVLRRLGIPVLVHGNLGGSGGATSAYLFRELGVMPSATVAQIQSALDAEGLAFVPAGVLCPGLAKLIALQSRLGLHDWVHKLTALLDPFRGEGVRIAGVADPVLREIIETVCSEERLDALVFDGADDDAFVMPCRRPGLSMFRQGVRSVLFEPESSSMQWRVDLPEPHDVAGTVSWIRRALSGEVPLPHPLVNQLACCLYASGYAADMNQAKAIAAMESGFLLAGEARAHAPGAFAAPDSQ